MENGPGPQIARMLRKLYQESDDNRKFFDLIAARKLDRQDTSVERIANETGLDNPTIVDIFKALADAEVGTFIVGRHGRKTRIKWKYSLRSIGSIAKGETKEPAPIPAGAKTEEDETPEGLTMIDHTFVVRNGLSIKIQLPEDLTTREAQRLANTILNIPFHP